MVTFAQKLTVLLNNSPLSQKEIADRIGVSASTISQMALGNRRPYLDQAFALAKVLKVSLDYLADPETKADADQTEKANDDPQINLGLIYQFLTMMDISTSEAIRRLAAGEFIRLGSVWVKPSHIVSIKVESINEPSITVRVHGSQAIYSLAGEDAKAVMIAVGECKVVRKPDSSEFTPFIMLPITSAHAKHSDSVIFDMHDRGYE